MTHDVKRAIDFDADVYRALSLKAAETERSISELVNDVVKHSLAEDAEDLSAFHHRMREPSLAFKDVRKDLRKPGKL